MRLKPLILGKLEERTYIFSYLWMDMVVLGHNNSALHDTYKLLPQRGKWSEFVPVSRLRSNLFVWPHLALCCVFPSAALIPSCLFCFVWL